jgi:hypothetical protein
LDANASCDLYSRSICLCGNSCGWIGW